VVLVVAVHIVLVLAEQELLIKALQVVMLLVMQLLEAVAVAVVQVLLVKMPLLHLSLVQVEMALQQVSQVHL
jgi:hypothetical protein